MPDDVFGVNTMSATPRMCGWCGGIHGVRCPNVRAVEYYADGAIKRVEFITPEPPKVDYSQVKIVGGFNGG